MQAREFREKATGAHRIQFEFSDEAYERMGKIKELTGATSFAELIRKALRVYEWVVQQEKNGYAIGLVKDGKMAKEVKFVL